MLLPFECGARNFREGDEMPLAEFVARSRAAFSAASERVRARYGYACSSALDQLAAIEKWGAHYPAGGTVCILHI